MVTSFCLSLSEPILWIGSSLYAGFPKIFTYLCPVPYCRKMYKKPAWYGKHVIKEHTDLCEVVPNVDVVLNHVKDTAAVVPPDNSPNNFKGYDNREEDNDRPATDLSEIFKELGFAIPMVLWRNPEPIPPPLSNNLTLTPEQYDPVESSSQQETTKETNELTHCFIFERVG